MKTTILILLAACAAPSVRAQSGPQNNDLPPFLTVQGRGESRVANTRAVIQLGFDAAGQEEAGVREDVTRRSQAVTGALKEQQVEGLQTTAVSIRPEFSHEPLVPGKRPLPPKITGYFGQVAINFRAPVEDAGRIISSMMGLGANSVSGMSTEPSDEERRKAENEALAAAAKDAEAQARNLLAALNLDWTGIRAIDATGQSGGPVPMPRMQAMMAEAAAPPPELDIQGGETVISREVTMQVTFGPR
ncbi:MAG: SIMPL domain-containing protein [Chthoniobacterales bacterium]